MFRFVFLDQISFSQLFLLLLRFQTSLHKRKKEKKNERKSKHEHHSAVNGALIALPMMETGRGWEWLTEEGSATRWENPAQVKFPCLSLSSGEVATRAVEHSRRPVAHYFLNAHVMLSKDNSTPAEVHAGTPDMRSSVQKVHKSFSLLSSYNLESPSSHIPPFNTRKVWREWKVGLCPRWRHDRTGIVNADWLSRIRWLFCACAEFWNKIRDRDVDTIHIVMATDNTKIISSLSFRVDLGDMMTLTFCLWGLKVWIKEWTWIVAHWPSSSD